MNEENNYGKRNKICPKCNEAVETADNYCIHCGSILNHFMTASLENTAKTEEVMSFIKGDRCLFNFEGKTFIGTVRKIIDDDNHSRVVITDSGKSFKVPSVHLKEIDLDTGDICFFTYQGMIKKGKIVHRNEHGFTVESDGQNYDLPADQVKKPKFKRGDTCHFLYDGDYINGTVIKAGEQQSIVKTDAGAFKVVNSLLSKGKKNLK